MIYRIILSIITIISIILVGYTDYYYYKSFYHLLLICGLINISIIGYVIINKISIMLKIFTKWLGI